MGPVAASDGARLHLQHGPIDLIIEAEGAGREAAYRRARARFGSILDELVEELPRLRTPLGEQLPAGPVARRMATAVARFGDVFITPMAAVAGAVADEIRHTMLGVGLDRIYVNNGGDIALHLSAGTSFDVGLVPVPDRPRPVGKMTITASSPVRGIATSGRHGRSLSLGIADSVTVLADTAAAADAAATVVANAVDLPGHPGIIRLPATDLDPDSDLSELPVTVDVAPLGAAEVAAALGSGRQAAARMLRGGNIVAAVLCLQGRVTTVGHPDGARRLVSSGW